MPTETEHPTFESLVTGHFREGRGYKNWRERGTNDWLLVVTLGGTGRFGDAGGGESLVGNGDAVLLRPGTRHDYGTAPGADGWELLWAHFEPRTFWREWMLWPEQTPGLMLLPLAEPILRGKIVARLKETHKLATGSLPQRERFAMNALEEVLLWCDTQNPRARNAPRDPRVQNVVDFIYHHLGDKMTGETLAEIGGLSPSRLAALFRHHVGQSPQQFIEAQRLARARQLLARTTQTVGTIASQVGFDNPFYFTLRFKHHTGLSPRAWRQREFAKTDGAD